MNEGTISVIMVVFCIVTILLLGTVIFFAWMFKSFVHEQTEKTREFSEKAFLYMKASSVEAGINAANTLEVNRENIRQAALSFNREIDKEDEPYKVNTEPMIVEDEKTGHKIEILDGVV